MVAGPGKIYNVAPATPAAGAEVTVSVPANARWRVFGLFYQLVTSSQVGNRNISLVLDDGSVVLYRVQAGGTTRLSQAASLTQQYLGVPGYAIQETAVDNGSGDIRIPLPSQILLPAGFRIRTVTAQIQTADQWTPSSLWVEEWISA
jgi:hypothetical protein